MKYIYLNNCHDGNKLAFVDPVSGVKVYGGGRMRGALPFKNMFIIDVGANFPKHQQIVKVVGDIPKELEEFGLLGIEKGVILDWQDGDKIHLPVQFWKALIEVIRAEGRDVLVACQGGHGRTGTALAILYALMTGSKHDPVEAIRKSYCSQSVETEEQIVYIEEVTGLKVKSRPSYEVRESRFRGFYKPEEF